MQEYEIKENSEVKNCAGSWKPVVWATECLLQLKRTHDMAAKTKNELLNILN